jgi:glycosyltransferase involved in cell wall biosynthesis
MFSIVIPLFNKYNYIEKCIKSVLSQSYTTFEVIVIDDGSTDNSLNIIKEINDNRLKIFTINNSGVSFARNVGILNSKYEFIAFLDADDTMGDGYLEKIRNLIIQFPCASIYSCNFFYNGINIANNLNIKEGYILNLFKLYNLNFKLQISSIVVNKIDAIKAGLFNFQIQKGEDIDFIFRLYNINKLVYSSTPFNFYNYKNETSTFYKIVRPEFIFSYHVDINFRYDRDEKIFLKKLILKRMFRYLFVDLNLIFFIILLRKQFKFLIFC